MDILLNKLRTIFEQLHSKFELIIPYFRTIKFKLAFLYSGILFIFSGSLVLIFNLYLGTSLHKDPDPTIVRVIPFGAPPSFLFDDFSQLRIEERQRIKDIRLNDLRRIQQMSILSLLPLAGLSFVAGYYLSGKFLEPLSRLKKNIEQLESKDLGIKLDFDEEDEVGSLIASFNDLSIRLQSAFHSQEQFVQDASHELRTPLTIIQTNLDTVLDNPTATKEEMAQAVTQALVGVRHLKKLVNYLLELTTAANRNFVPVNLFQLLKIQVAIFGDQASIKGTPLIILNKRRPTSVVLGDEILIGRVFTNLIENAIKYSKEVNGKMLPIHIALSGNRKLLTVVISNYGETINSSQVEHLFERFYQVEPSRSKKLGGYGLGLSIVKKIIEEHNGTIKVESSNEKTMFIVKLPVMK